MYRPKIVSVDTNTVSYGDIDFSPVEALGDVSFYGVLTPAELEEAAKDADFLLVNKAEVTRAARYCRTEIVGEHGVFRIIFVISAVVGRAVRVETGCQEYCSVRPERVRTEQSALLFKQLLVERCAENGLGYRVVYRISCVGVVLLHGCGVVLFVGV